MTLVITRASPGSPDAEVAGARWDGPLLVKRSDLTHETVREMALDAYYDGGRGPLCRSQDSDVRFGGREPLAPGLRAVVWHNMPDTPAVRAGWRPGSTGTDRGEVIAEYAQLQCLGSWDMRRGYAVAPGWPGAAYLPPEARVHASREAALAELEDAPQDSLCAVVVACGRRIAGLA